MKPGSVCRSPLLMQGPSRALWIRVNFFIGTGHGILLAVVPEVQVALDSKSDPEQYRRSVDSGAEGDRNRPVLVLQTGRSYLFTSERWGGREVLCSHSKLCRSGNRRRL